MIDEGTLASIREELERSDRVDAAGVEVAAVEGTVVLRGAVATDEEATVAALVAERYGSSVRNELRVDAGLREDQTEALVDEERSRQNLQGSSASDARPRAQELSVQTSEPLPVALSDDLTTEVDEALAENVAWDPPDEPQLGPTAGEQRGVSERDGRTVAPAGEGELDAPDEVEPSLADMSAAELARSIRPEDEDERADG